MSISKSRSCDDVVPVRANITTCDDVLERSGIRRIDFLSIDVEPHEPPVLEGFSIDKYRPRLIGIESHPEVRQQNLWFAEFKPSQP